MNYSKYWNGGWWVSSKQEARDRDTYKKKSWRVVFKENGR